MPELLLLDRSTLLKIKEVKEYSRENPMLIDEMKDVMIHKKSVAGDREEHIIIIPTNYRIVYNVEEQTDANLYHHISISCLDGKVPSPYLVSDILPFFDMDTLNEDDIIWLDGKIVNILKIWKKLDDRGLIQSFTF